MLRFRYIFIIIFVAIFSAYLPIRSRAQESSEDYTKDEESPSYMKLDDMKAEEIFQSICSTCHGKDGRGISDEERKKLGLDTMPPNFRDPKFNSREPASFWEGVIKYGGKTYGYSHFMPAFGGILTEQNIKDLVSYLKSIGYDKRYPQGELNFTRPFFTTKAFPEDELLYIVNFTQANRNSFKNTVYLAKRFGPVYQIEIKGVGEFSDGELENELEGGFKWCFFHSKEILFLSSAGIEFSVYRGGWSYIPYLSFGKGLGSSGDLSLQGNLKFKHDPKNGNLALISSIASAYDITLAAGRIISPVFEFIYENDFRSGRFYLSPQVYLAMTKRGHVALSLGFRRIILGSSAEKFSVVGFLLWDFADGWFFEGW